MGRPKKVADNKVVIDESIVKWRTELHNVYNDIRNSPTSIEAELLMSGLNVTDSKFMYECKSIGIIIYENSEKGNFDIYSNRLEYIMSKAISVYKTIENALMSYIYDEANRLLLCDSYDKKYHNFVLTFGLVVDTKNMRFLDFDYTSPFNCNILGNLAYGGRYKDGIVNLDTLDFECVGNKFWDSWRLHELNGERLLLAGVDEIIPLKDRNLGYLIRKNSTYKLIKSVKNFYCYEKLISLNSAIKETLYIMDYGSEYALLEHKDGRKVVYALNSINNTLTTLKDRGDSYIDWSDSDLDCIAYALESKINKTIKAFIQSKVLLDMSDYTKISRDLFLDETNKVLLKINETQDGLTKHKQLNELRLEDDGNEYILKFYDGLNLAILDDKYDVYSSYSLVKEDSYGRGKILFVNHKLLKTCILEGVKRHYYSIKNNDVRLFGYETKGSTLSILDYDTMEIIDLSEDVSRCKTHSSIKDYNLTEEDRDEYILLKHENLREAKLMGNFLYTLCYTDTYGIFDLRYNDITKSRKLPYLLDSIDTKINIRLEPIVNISTKNQEFTTFRGIYAHNNDLIITSKGHIKSLANFYDCGYTDSDFIKEICRVLEALKVTGRLNSTQLELVDSFLTNELTIKNLK